MIIQVPAGGINFVKSAALEPKLLFVKSVPKLTGVKTPLGIDWVPLFIAKSENLFWVSLSDIIKLPVKVPPVNGNLVAIDVFISLKSVSSKIVPFRSWKV